MSTAGDYTGWEYEKDSRWLAVDKYALHHLHRDDLLAEALQQTKALGDREGLPNIEVSTLQGKFLAVQAQLINAKHILEVGTLGGYSAIWFASTGRDVKVTTIEINEHHKQIAESAIAAAGYGDQIEVILGAGNEVLPRLRAQVEAGERPYFDLTFIDADKENNLAYFNEAILMSRSRGCIIVDNVVRKGNLADEEQAKTDTRVRGSRQVVEGVGSHTRVLQSTLVQTVGEKNYDGFLIAVVK